MHLMEAIVRSPVKIAVGVLLVALFGVIAAFAMPKQLTPEVEVPTITVETRWRGASPHEVEREIIQEQEEQLKGVEGVTKMSSEARDSQAQVTLEFQVGTDMSEALLKVNSRLQQVPEYPEDADQPVISSSSAADRPFAWFVLSPKRPADEKFDEVAAAHPELADQLAVIRQVKNPGLLQLRLRELAEGHAAVAELLPPADMDIAKLRRFAEDVIEARFERVAGVSNSNVIGGLDEEMQVVVDPEKLAARQLTIEDLRFALRAQNLDTSAGDLWEGKRRWVVRTLGQFNSPQDVEDQVIYTGYGAPVYVRDVAEVHLGYKKPDSLVQRYGSVSIAVNAIRETGANLLDVMQELRAANEELNEGVLRHRGLELALVQDDTDYIYSAIGLVQENIFIGGALTMIVLMVSLHFGLRTLLAIPFIAATSVAAAYVSPWFFAVTLLIIVGCGFWFARGALVVGLAIPTSIVGSFLVLGILGRSLNVVSLAGLAFAVGMLVDNAIVVLENVYRRYEMGEPPFTAAVRATQEVWGAVAASTLTTLAVFLPVVFVQQEAGQLFRDIALAISAGVGLSLIVSITVIPAASARLFGDQRDDAERGESAGQSRSHGHGNGQAHGHAAVERRVAVAPPGRGLHVLVESVSGAGALFVESIARGNRWLQRGLWRRLGVVVGLVAAAVGVSYLLWPKVEYLPNGNRNLVIGFLLPPPGYNLDQLTSMGKQVEDELRPYWDVSPEVAEAEERGERTPGMEFPAIKDFFFVARNRQVFLGLRSLDEDRAKELVPLVQRVGKSLPGTFVVANQTSLFERGLSAGRKIDIEITGPELTRLVELGGGILRQFSTGPAGEPSVIVDAQVRPVPSLDLSSPEVHLRPRLEQAAEMGVWAVDLGYTVDALVDGAYAGDYFVGGDKIDLTIKGQTEFAQRTQDIEAMSVATPNGELVPLGALAEVRLASGPEQINHRERQRAITIEVTPPPEMALEDAQERIQSQIVEPLLAGGALDGGYSITLGGTADKLRDTWSALKWNVILAVLITYLLMAALFESWLYPFVVILSVPLGAVGGLMGLALLNVFVLQTLDVLTMLGFVILVGTVVNNPILIVHQALNHIRDDGMPVGEAIVESTRTRVRPIFMTTGTTLLGLLPLVLFPGAGSELYRGIGSVLLGGLLVSTVFTVVFVPALLSLALDAKAAVWDRFRRVGRRPRDFAPPHVPPEKQPLPVA